MPSSLPGRQPRTTASIVRTRLIFVIPTRSPGRYGASWRLAITPSACWSQGCASSGSSVEGVRSTGLSTTAVRRSRRSACGSSKRTSSSRASRSKAMNRVGVFSASIAIRDAAGWIRWPSASKSWRAVGVEEDDLAVEHVAALGERELGEVARQRAAVARLQVDLAAVDEGDRAEAVPLRLVDPAVAGRQRARRLGELREDGWGEGQRHAARCYPEGISRPARGARRPPVVAVRA